MLFCEGMWGRLVSSLEEEEEEEMEQENEK